MLDTFLALHSSVCVRIPQWTQSSSIWLGQWPESLEILIPSPQSWDYRCTLLCLASIWVPCKGSKLRASCFCCKHFIALRHLFSPRDVVYISKTMKIFQMVSLRAYSNDSTPHRPYGYVCEYIVSRVIQKAESRQTGRQTDWQTGRQTCYTDADVCYRNNVFLEQDTAVLQRHPVFVTTVPAP